MFPGDTGIARGLSPARFGNVSPRLGVAYSPNEKTSLRASYGLFYNAFQGLSAGIMYGVPPYGYNYLSPAPPLFDTPFITAADGTNNGQRFPQQFPPFDASPSNPVTNIDWSQFLPVNADPFFGSTNKTPYSANFMFSVAARAGAEHGRDGELRRHAAATTCSSFSRRTRAIRRCVSASARRRQVAPGSATCGPFGENGVYTTQGRDGHQRHAPGARAQLRHRDEADVRRVLALQRRSSSTFATRKGPASILAGYTYSKSVDVASNLGEQVNPFNIALSEAPSAFDMRHNFVVSYNYELPFEQLVRLEQSAGRRAGRCRARPGSAAGSR